MPGVISDPNGFWFFIEMCERILKIFFNRFIANSYSDNVQKLQLSSSNIYVLAACFMWLGSDLTPQYSMKVKNKGFKRWRLALQAWRFPNLLVIVTQTEPMQDSPTFPIKSVVKNKWAGICICYIFCSYCQDWGADIK